MKHTWSILKLYFSYSFFCDGGPLYFANLSLLCEETDAPFLENVQNSNLSKLKPKPKLKPFKTQTLLDLFLFSDAGICSTMAFPPLGNSYHVVVSVSIDFPSNSQRNAPLHGIAYDYSRGD